ncbi:TetR/AcrR family transcriptional regulator [Aestuariispira insulae]|uniref:TetR family transcriptional regulator n=1 Tax=Aestuariispira insulae TaxID=1461337 RepID=A0A3D9HR92_9PROT|nr:TetR/AcrR family transcriptional regulator [Aestuariispira insulae]RED51998.1 TetR family transcriptional regulator [Aestuariispira insulae]
MSKANEILDVAEDMVQRQGYNGFSFRDIAETVGIKSASVHYHYPTKAALGSALAKRYTDRFLQGMPDSEDSSIQPLEKLTLYVSAFRNALMQDGKMCLCGMLGAESASLPKQVNTEVERFFQMNKGWLEALYRGVAEDRRLMSPAIWAMRTLATLEGAMIVARTMSDMEGFDLIAKSLLNEVSEASD